MTKAALQDAGRIAMAKSLAAQPAYFAWGRGDGVWDSPPAIPTNRTTLIDEVGRRLCTEVRYVLPSSEEESKVEIGKGADKKHYKFSDDPTPWLYVRAQFSSDDADGERIRECGLFFGTTAKASVPPGQRYLTPEQVQDAGYIWSLSYRSVTVREGQKPNEEAVLAL